MFQDIRMAEILSKLEKTIDRMDKLLKRYENAVKNENTKPKGVSQ